MASITNKHIALSIRCGIVASEWWEGGFWRMGVERESDERRCPGANAWGQQFTVHRNLKIEIILELSLSHRF